MKSAVWPALCASFAVASSALPACSQSDSTGGDSTSTTGSGTGTGTGGSGASVVQFHNDLARDGLYVDPAFTKAAAPKLHKDPAFHATIAGATFAQPLYFEGAAGGKNLVIAATMQNQVYALDAATGAVVWQKQAGMPAQGSEFSCGDMATIGITGTPVIDPASKTIFFDAANPGPVRKIHAWSLDDGSERAGWPVDVVANVKTGATTFNPQIQSQRAAPTLVNGTLYVPYGGINGDCGNYRGWVVGISVNDPSQIKVFATGAVKSGIWGLGGIASDGAQLFVTTGNAPGGSTFGQQESILRMQAGPTFSGMAADYFTPSNWQALDNGDVDLGGSAAILVDVPGATPSKLAVALGKDGIIYLADRENLGGISANGAMGQGVASAKVASNAIIQAAAAYTTAKATYVVLKGNGVGCPAGQSGDLTAVSISATSPPRPTVAWCAQQGGNGSPMVTTTDGHSEAIVWSLGSRLMGFDGDTGAVIFGGGGAGDTVGALSKWVTPIAAAGRIFVASNTEVSAFTAQ